MNSIDQQWHDAQILSRADIAIDDVWSRYLSLGGTADPVALTAYLHGTLLLSSLQQNLVTHAVNDVFRNHHGGPTDALCPAASGTVHQAVSGTGTSWPALRIRLSGMFDPDRAEQKRLAALQGSGLIRAGKEERFDRFTREARETFGVRSAAITLVTDTEQLVKSVTGPLGGVVPREVSFCTHTITEDRALIVTDAATDDQFRENPLVVGAPHLRFYAGYPVTGHGGWRIGALCLLDTEPRTFDENDRKSLVDLVHRVEAEIIGV